MLKKLLNSLIFKISTSILIFETLILVGLGIYYVNKYSEEIDKRVLTNIGFPSVLMSQGAMVYDSVRDIQTVENLVNQKVENAFVINKEGNILYASDLSFEDTKISSVLNDNFVRHVLSGEKIQKIIELDKKYLLVLNPLFFNKNHIGYLYLKVDVSKAEEDKKQVKTGYFLSMIFCIFLTTISEVMVIYKIVVPRVRDSVRCLKEAGEGNLKVRIDNISSLDEIGKSQININDMLNKIDERTQEKEKFQNNLQKSLKEKEILLLELHHRTKNNMQVVQSMLALHRNFTSNTETKKILREAELKIKAISLVHKKLYQSDNLSKLNLNDYISDLARVIFKSYRITSEKIELDINIENIMVLIDIAIPLGLVLNELITNSIKHAFFDKMEGKISIKLERNEQGSIEFLFKDNGVGIPNNFDFRKQKTLGILTIYNIVETQLLGKVEFKSENGISCYMSFKDNLYYERV